MTEKDFCYWLQGFSEIQGNRPTEKQWRIIQDHLQLVFHKVTPNYIFESKEQNPIFLSGCGYGANLPFKNSDFMSDTLNPKAIYRTC